MDATPTLLHSASRDIAAVVKRSDIVVAAIGSPHFVKPEWVKPGAAVLDVGISRGGVGPMTRAMLLKNVVEMARA